MVKFKGKFAPLPRPYVRKMYRGSERKAPRIFSELYSSVLTYLV